MSDSGRQKYQKWPDQSSTKDKDWCAGLILLMSYNHLNIKIFVSIE